MKKLSSIKFRVEVNPVLVEKVSELMSNCDLGISRIIKSEFYSCSWNTTTLIDKEYKKRMKKRVKEAFELDGSKVLSIKLVK